MISAGLPLCRKALPLMSAVLLLGGCSWWGHEADPCVSVEEYQQAQEVPALTVPAGLDKPDASGRLNVPAEPQAAEPLSQTAGCLLRPPSYFDKPLKETAK